MKCGHNGSAHMFECRRHLAPPAAIPELIPGPLLTKHHPRCLCLECDWVGGTDLDLSFYDLIPSFIIRIFLMILVRIKGYNRNILSIPGNQRYQGMELHQTFQKRINKPLLR